MALGSFYALIALGYTMVYGTLKFINFAHGDVFMLGAWLSFAVAKAMQWTVSGAAIPAYAPLVILAAAMAACGIIGFLIEFLAYRPLRGAPRLNVLITAIGVSLLIQNICILPFVFGTQPVRLPPIIPERTLATIADVKIGMVDVAGLVVVIALMATLEFIISKTKAGRAMRAVSHDPAVASLMGIPVNRTISLTFIIGSVLAAAAGFLYAIKYPMNQASSPSWVLLGLKAFVAAVLGGIGNVRGAMVGGFIIGLAEQFGAAYVSSNLRDVYVFSILIAILLFKPSGLFGRNVVEKV